MNSLEHIDLIRRPWTWWDTHELTTQTGTNSPKHTVTYRTLLKFQTLTSQTTLTEGRSNDDFYTDIF